MPETKPHVSQRKPGEAWTEEEKQRGAATPDEAGEAGEANAGGRPNDDRAATEAAAANTDPKPQP